VVKVPMFVASKGCKNCRIFSIFVVFRKSVDMRDLLIKLFLEFFIVITTQRELANTLNIE
jgi:hypothetical protein